MSFSSSIGRFRTNTYGARARNLRDGVLTQLFAQVILGTPFDTGRARGGWIPTKDKPSTEVSTKLDKTGTTTLNNARAFLRTAETGDVLFFVNNVEYITILEGGRRTVTLDSGVQKEVGSIQAPDGIVRVVVGRFRETVNAELRRVVR